MTRLIVDPLTRVEGHGRVELLLEGDRLHDVKVRLLESPRLFEALVVGRRYDEVPDLICRICAICSAVHKLTSLQALEKAMDVVVPPMAVALRELLLLGGHIQSHALHLFCLILPDLRDSTDVVALLRQQDPLAKAGLDLKAFGNRIQQVAGGRIIHPINPVFSGVAYFPERGDLDDLAAELTNWQRDWPDFAKNFSQAGNYPESSRVLGNAVATGQADAFSLTGEHLWHEKTAAVPVSDYAGLLDERSRKDSHAKDAAGEAGPFLTGALARARLAAIRGLSVTMTEDNLGIHENNIAQVREIEWALQRAGQLLDLLLSADRAEPLQALPKAPRAGVGTAAVEAPRGLLVHHYVVDEWGTVVAADIVTPTSINQRVMAAQIMADLVDEQDHQRLMTVAERIVRAYDPCISCAVHLVPVAASSASARILDH
jgi:coenzyme F420-reducing hydrogenase alpha subunit